MNVPSAVHDGLLAWHALNQRLALMLLHHWPVCLCLTLNETLCNSPKVLCASGTLWWKVPDVKLNLIWVLLTSQMWLADEKSVISWWREEYFNLYVNMRNNSENKHPRSSFKCQIQNKSVFQRRIWHPYKVMLSNNSHYSIKSL